MKRRAMPDAAPPPRPWSLSGEVAQLTHAAQGKSAQLRRKVRLLFTRTRAYRTLFFDAEGRLRPEARTVIADIIDKADLHRASLDLDPQALAELEGRRRMAMHIFGRFNVPQSQLDALERDLSDMENDR